MAAARTEAIKLFNSMVWYISASWFSLGFMATGLMPFFMVAVRVVGPVDWGSVADFASIGASDGGGSERGGNVCGIR